MNGPNGFLDSCVKDGIPVLLDKMAANNVFCWLVLCLLFLLHWVETTVVPLTDLNFQEQTIGGPYFVMFYGGW